MKNKTQQYPNRKNADMEKRIVAADVCVMVVDVLPAGYNNMKNHNQRNK